MAFVNAYVRPNWTLDYYLHVRVLFAVSFEGLPGLVNAQPHHTTSALTPALYVKIDKKTCLVRICVDNERLIKVGREALS